MITLFLKRLTTLLMAIISLFTAGSSGRYSDNYAGFDFPCIAAKRQKAFTYRIMSYNIRCGDVNGTEVSDRIGIGVRQIRQIMPDSLGIQEATGEWMKALDKKLVLYDWVGVEREEGGDPRNSGESCPIFYLKTRFQLVDSGYFWISDTPEVPSLGPGAACKRICTWARLRKRFSKKEFVHVNTHFDHVSEEARVEGGKIVKQFIEENFSNLPVVFTADMNTTPEGEAYATMTTNLQDARLAAEDAAAFGTFHGSDVESWENYYIDFVLCTKQFEIKTYRTVTKGVDGRFTSDHFPIYADLKLK